MRHQPARLFGRSEFCVLAAIVSTALLGLSAPQSSTASEPRRTAIVEAVERARTSIVNIHGEKTVDSADARNGDVKRRVNGMGTGIIIDERGYIITNHHVVDGVKKIMVSTSARDSFVAKLVSHDPKTDLAIIKIDGEHPFDVIRIGTSSDLMPGETVIAVGNAFGYEHTVTRGIISALHRTVQVSDAQNYEDLIQTDASINPGNSGGPLLNIEGDMIGVNVAVRAGAQGIGFAIPADKVMIIATELLSIRRIDHTWHGLVSQASTSSEGAVLESIDDESPAAQGGLQSGDVITAVGETLVVRPLDVERALLGHHAGESVSVHVQRKSQPMTMKLVLASAPGARPLSDNDPVWDLLGLKLQPISTKQFQQFRSRYRGGLAVIDVRPDSPAAKQGIRGGDVLVGMHVWETVSLENVNYILGRSDFTQLDPLKFYIIRGSETLYGHFKMANRAPSAAQ
jgi:serine protease Do